MSVVGRALGVFLCLWLGGCATLVVAGGGSGGGYGGAREPTSVASDASLTNQVKSELISSEKVQAWRINVSVHEAVVTLDGNVSSAQQRTEAEWLARGVDGVRTVINQLEIVLEP